MLCPKSQMLTTNAHITGMAHLTSAIKDRRVKVVTNNRKSDGVAAQMYKKEDMSEEGWNEFITLRGDAADTANIIKAEGGEAIPFFGDVSD